MMVAMTGNGRVGNVAMQLSVNNVCCLLSVCFAIGFLPNQRYWTRLSNLPDKLIQLIGQMCPERHVIYRSVRTC